MNTPPAVENLDGLIQKIRREGVERAHQEADAIIAAAKQQAVEIVRDRAVVSAIPEVKVTHPLAKVTHEAAIGSVDGKQLETLMARGLDPEQAVDLIIRGMLS